jgi:putative Holliday junction resolvase
MQAIPKVILALDVGEKRIGVARARSDVRLASPLLTLPNDENIWQNLTDLLQEQAAVTLVVGLPRGLEGQSTAQTRSVEAFVQELRQHVSAEIRFQDEAVTSAQAEAELNARGKPYAKGDVDALAATYILEDYLNSPEVQNV